MTKKKRILLIGNGFDIAHELKTRYSDVLFTIRNCDEMFHYYECLKNKTLSVSPKMYEEYLQYYEYFSDKKVERFKEIVKTNSWVKYFKENNAIIEKWVDFEKEMIPVLNAIKKAMNKEKIPPNSEYFNYVRLFSKYLSPLTFRDDSELTINNEYVIDGFIDRHSIVADLKAELDEFIELLEIYFSEIVQKGRLASKRREISAISPDYIVSFNYTWTEQLYVNENVKTFNIHGSADRGDKYIKSNIVLGINEDDIPSNDFIYYAKFFQRLQKRIGTTYKEFVRDAAINSGTDDTASFNLYIYGHSLDATDKDVLRYFLIEESSENEILRPEVTYIYYYDQKDYEEKLINLIGLFGRSFVEKSLENERIVFWETEKH